MRFCPSSKLKYRPREGVTIDQIPFFQSDSSGGRRYYYFSCIMAMCSSGAGICLSLSFSVGCLVFAEMTRAVNRPMTQLGVSTDLVSGSVAGG